MDKKFWQQKWENNEIAFHGSEPHPLLVKNFNKLSSEKVERVFIPLCGKTLDISWFLSNGYSIVGVELSQKAIEQLFQELGIIPKISKVANFDHYHAKNIDIFVGDFFELSKAILGNVDIIYDRAALVALPDTLRHKYTSHLTNITNKTPQLLICYEYDQKMMEGPPFSITSNEVHLHYQDHYQLHLVESINMPQGLKGSCAAKENVWLLKKKNAFHT